MIKQQHQAITYTAYKLIKTSVPKCSCSCVCWPEERKNKQQNMNRTGSKNKHKAVNFDFLYSSFDVATMLMISIPILKTIEYVAPCSIVSEYVSVLNALFAFSLHPLEFTSICIWQITVLTRKYQCKNLTKCHTSKYQYLSGKYQYYYCKYQQILMQKYRYQPLAIGMTGMTIGMTSV